MKHRHPVSSEPMPSLMMMAIAVITACATTKTRSAADPAPATVHDATRPTSSSETAVAAAGAASLLPSPSDRALLPPDTTAAPHTMSTAEILASPLPTGIDRKPPFEAPYWPTPQPVVERMLELANVKSTDLVYDLGCGDARSLVTAAQRFGARGVGIDIDVRLVAMARENVRRSGVEHLVQIEQGDIFTRDISNADVVFLYLLERMNARLIPQLEQLRPGSRIVAHEFGVPGIKPTKTIQFPGPPDGPPSTDEASTSKTHTLYLWKLPWRKHRTI